MPVGHYHSPLCLRGQVYSLAHFDPFRFEAHSTKVPRPPSINVRFTNHCYSEAFDPALHPMDEPEIVDGKRRRVFFAGTAISFHTTFLG